MGRPVFVGLVELLQCMKLERGSMEEISPHPCVQGADCPMSPNLLRNEMGIHSCLKPGVPQGL